MNRMSRSHIAYRWKMSLCKGMVRLPWRRIVSVASVAGAILLTGFALPASGQDSTNLLATKAKDEYIIEHTLKLTKGTVYAALFSPNQKHIVTLGANFAIRLWDTETGRVTKDFRTGNHQATSIVYHPQEEVVFTGGKDRTVRAWDLAKASTSMVLKGHNSAVTALLSGPEGKILFSGDSSGTVIVWDTGEGKKLTKFSAHSGPVTAMTLHPDGKHLVTGGRDRNIKVWDWGTGKVVNAFSGHTGTINTLKFPDDPALLYSGSSDGSVKIWKWDDTEKPIQDTLFDHKRSVTNIALHPNNKWMITGSLDETIKIWNLDTKRVIQELTLVEGPITTLALSSNGRRLVAGYRKDRVRTWKLDKSAFLASLKGHKRSLIDMDFTKDGKFLISAAIDKSIKIWNLRTRKPLRNYRAGNHVVQMIRFSPTDKFFATGGGDGTAQIWDTARGKVVKRFKGHGGKVNAVAFHPRGNVLLTGGSDKSWILWDTKSGRIIRRATAHNDQVMTVGFSPDGRFFATGSEDAEIRVWSYPNGNLVQTLKGHGSGVVDLAFHPTGRSLASSSKDFTVKLWNPRTGEQLYNYTGHDFIVSRVRFSADGRALVSVSRDKTVKLWDAQTGKFIRTVSGEREQILALAVSRDGKVMATGSIGPDINLMVYPLKVMFAKETDKGAVRKEDDKATGTAGKEEEKKEEDIDLSKLEKGKDEAEELAYKAVASGDAEALLRLERSLNAKLTDGDYCKNEKAIETLAHQILILAPYDKAAYHALMITGIVNQDLKMIFLMSKIGLRALFLGGVYDYDLPSAVDANMAFWRDEIFDPARKRAGRKLVLEIVDCNNQPQEQSMPTELLALDLPREVLKILASRKARVNFRGFSKVNSETFLKRIYYLIDEAINSTRKRRKKNQPFTLALEKAKPRKVGLLALDLSEVDTFGYPERVPFGLRRERGAWLTYTTDMDRKKDLLLPQGNYYLRIDKKMRKVFTIAPQKQVPVMVSKR